MPELPETETIARDLDRVMRGATIERVTVAKPDVLRLVRPGDLARRAVGTTIRRCWRRAKLVVVDLDSGDRLVVQPRFTGGLLVDDGQLTDEDRAYIAVTFDLRDGRALHYRDVRRLGTVALMTPEAFELYTGRLGVEPLDPAFTDAHLSGLLRGSRQAVKKVLMDQRALAGVGNIYANEALWRAKLDPSREARSLAAAEIGSLRAAVVAVLSEAIAARGTSFRDYRDARGQRGGFVARLAAYGRAGEPCSRCQTRLVGTHAVDGRTTVFCPRCQR